MTASPSDKYRANVAEASRAHGEVQKRNALLTGKRQAKRGGMCGLRGILKPPTGHSSKARALVRDKGELHLTTLDPGSSPGVPIERRRRRRMDTTGTIGTVNNYCVHKLPCGICRLTMAQCLKDPYTITPMWETQDICVKTTTGTITTTEGKEE